VLPVAQLQRILPSSAKGSVPLRAGFRTVLESRSDIGMRVSWIDREELT